MEWYSGHSKNTKLAVSNPPAYMMERISDLRHACDLSNRAPGEAARVVRDVVKQLTAHHDDSYAKHLSVAADRMLDSPKKATEDIMRVIAVMLSEKEQHEAELEKNKRVKPGIQ